MKLKTEEIKMLKSENAALNQRYLEALALLDVTQQKMAQENPCAHPGGSTEVSSLEVGSVCAGGMRGFSALLFFPMAPWCVC